MRLRFGVVVGFIWASVASAQEFRLAEATIDEVHASIQAGRLSCRDLVQRYLNRIEAYNHEGPHLNAVQFVNPRALQEADALDASFESSGLSGPLHCIPVLLKDQVETSDMPTSYGSAIFEEFVPQRDATIVVRLKNAGAIILAKTTMGEFASRYVGSAYGVIRNAYDPTRNPSGSSGGTGAAVAANLGMVGIGEDTGGSIRGPAAVHSLVGLRPTTPLVSRFGMMPANPANDTLGPMTRTVRDAAIVLDALVGYDPNDPITAYAVGHVPSSYTELLHEDGLSGARIGVIREPMDPKADPSASDFRRVRDVIDRAIADLRSLGADVIDPVVIGNLDMADPTYVSDEFETERATDAYLAEHANAPVMTLKEILLTGEVIPWRASGLMNVLGRAANEADYLRVILDKEELRRSVLTAMAAQDLDALLYATFDHEASAIAPDVLDNPKPNDGYGKGNNRYLSPVIGFPAITVPAGFTSNELPVGLELMARPFTEGRLLRFAYAYERATLRRRPPNTAPPLPGEP